MSTPATQRALRTALAVAAAPALIAGLVLGLAVGWLAGIIAFVVLGAAVAGWARMGGERIVVARLGGRPADPVSDARLVNLVEGLATGAGVRQPRLVVVDSPGLNALAAGTSSSKSILAVTAGLLAELDRIELEAVLAEELWLIRHDEVIPLTVLAATFGLGRSWALSRERDTAADQGAVSLTRYPPALAAALEKIEAKGAVVAGQPSYLADLWLADPRPPGQTGQTGPTRPTGSPTPAPTPAPTAPAATPAEQAAPPGPLPGRGRLPLPERIEALREL